jgi:hypothetical protein
VVRARTLACVAASALWLAAGACGKVLGIHDSHLRDAAAGSPGDGAAGDGGAGRGDAGGVTGAGGASGAGGLMGGAGAAAGTGGAGGAAGTGVDAHPSDDTRTDVKDAGDEAVVKDAAAEAPPTCKPNPPTPVVAFQLASGPNNGDTTTGACEYPNDFLPRDKPGAHHYYVAASSELFALGLCGACLVVENTQGAFEVQVIDSTTLSKTINVDSAVFQGLGGNNPTVKVHVAPCDYGGTIQAAFRGQDDAAVILYNFSTRPKKVEISSPDGTPPYRLMTPPQQGNYWVPPGNYTPGSSAKLRLTDDYGSVIETAALRIDGSYQETGVQFAPCTP